MCSSAWSIKKVKLCNGDVASETRRRRLGNAETSTQKRGDVASETRRQRCNVSSISVLSSRHVAETSLTRLPHRGQNRSPRRCRERQRRIRDLLEIWKSPQGVSEKNRTCLNSMWLPRDPPSLKLGRRCDVSTTTETRVANKSPISFQASEIGDQCFE